MSQLRSDAAEPLPSVEGALSFIVPQDTKPVFHSTALTGGEAKIFFELEDVSVSVADMRPIAENLSVDTQGFELLHHETQVDDLYDDAAVDSTYHAEVEDILRERFDATHVAIFDVTRRSDDTGGARNPDGLRGPATRVHVDYTVASGPQRAKDVLGEAEYERLIEAGARILQVNVWRPISGPVKRSPLALADAASIATEELVATDQVFADRVGEIYQVAHGAGQRWYYASEIDRDEILLIKGWDSIDDGRAHFTPHGAFELQETAPDAPPRESIEVRTFVIIE
ncbi:MAG: CmcJ/NvfI family oxidoreductase [Alphaproteobacteria bacterium]